MIFAEGDELVTDLPEPHDVPALGSRMVWFSMACFFCQML